MSSLARPGEVPAETLARLERLPGPEFVRILESDAGQALMAALRRQHRAARRPERKAATA